MSNQSKTKLSLAIDRISAHFEPIPLDQLVTVAKILPETVRPDLESGIETILQGKASFFGVNQGNSYRALTFNNLISDRRDPPTVTPPQYMDIELGAGASARCITTGMWLFHIEDAPAALLISQNKARYGDLPGVRVEAIMSAPAGGRDEAQALLNALAKALTAHSVYRGKALSFETVRSFGGGLGALKVHDFEPMTLDQVILPKATIKTLERTVFGFVKARAALKSRGFSSKRGLLLYGPPGTGKTHFIRYLISQLPTHTTMLVTAEQVAAFDQIMSIARALQPAIVVIEDADLLARARELRGENDCSQMLLNSLLNHMDGLNEDAEIMFILTTNRPQYIEEAVRDRPGRVDQAIEIPLPDADCRQRLLTLYCHNMPMAAGVVEACVKRSDKASAAFMRELARRMAQFAILRGESQISLKDMHLALEEMLGAGSFTAKALGAGPI